eukprot:6198518-Pleurochrysis_carterae.AAC.4
MKYDFRISMSQLPVLNKFFLLQVTSFIHNRLELVGQLRDIGESLQFYYALRVFPAPILSGRIPELSNRALPIAQFTFCIVTANNQLVAGAYCFAFGNQKLWTLEVSGLQNNGESKTNAVLVYRVTTLCDGRFVRTCR